MLFDQEKRVIGAQGVTRDVTAQKHTEQELKQSEERYRTLVEHQMEAVCRWLPDTTLTFVNEGYCKVFGKTREELIGTKFLYFLEESEQKSFKEYVASLMRNPRVDVREHKIHAYGGKLCWMEWINSPLFDEHGTVIEFQGIGRDITERRKLEEKVCIRTHALESSINGIALMDFRGIITYVNSSFLKMVGCTNKSEVLGEYFGAYFETREISEQIIEALHKNELWRGELPFQKKSAPSIYIELSANVVKNHKREPISFMFSFIDISGRKEAEMCLKKAYNTLEQNVEERTRELKTTNTALQKEITERHQYEKALKAKSEEQELLLNNVDTQIWYMSGSETYRLVNKACAKFLGKPRAFFRGKNLFTFKDKDEAEISYANIQKVYEAKQSINSKEWHKDRYGENRLLSVTRTPKLDEKGNIKYIIGVANDITDRMKAQKELEKNKSQLERSQKVAQVATWEMDYQTGEVFFSEEQYRLLGYQPHEITLEMETIKNHIHPEDLASMRKTIRKSQGNLKSFDIKCRYYTKNGQERLGHWIAEIDRNEQGQVLRIYGTMQDITDHNRMEQELRKAKTSYQQLLQSTQQRKQFHNIIGKNEQMQKIYILIQQLADINSTVLITGESGTGKELIVEALHYASQRANSPLIKVNTSALSEALLDSEIFGHVRGAFTGAEKNKIGRIEAAEGGTLFLDEIGEISHNIQLKLLRFLETKEFERVGDSKTLKANVRIVVATNVDLNQKVKEGSLRKDLYYRLNVINIYAPPLMKRRDDIPLLANYFLHHFKQSFKKNITGISKEVMGIFMNYQWPGNVREFKHAIEHACILCHGGEIGIEHLPKELFQEHKESHRSFQNKTWTEVSKAKIVEALDLSHGNKIKAAKILGVSRRTLYRKMHQYKMIEKKNDYSEILDK